MNRMLHNTLPTKSKIWKHVKKEIEDNKKNNTNNTYWQEKYPNVQDNLCVLCSSAKETVEHFMVCTHPRAIKYRQAAYTSISTKLKPKISWFQCQQTSSRRKLGNFSAWLGSMGLITKQLQSMIFKNMSPKKSKESFLHTQLDLIEAHLKIWLHRNYLLFGVKDSNSKYRNNITLYH